MLVFLWPLGKNPQVGIAAVKVLVQGAISGETGQTFALGFHPLVQGGPVDDAVAHAVGETAFEETQLERGHALVFHLIRGAQPGEFGLNSGAMK
jgi:hypothetical protein